MRSEGGEEGASGSGIHKIILLYEKYIDLNKSNHHITINKHIENNLSGLGHELDSPGNLFNSKKIFCFVCVSTNNMFFHVLCDVFELVVIVFIGSDGLHQYC